MTHIRYRALLWAYAALLSMVIVSRFFPNYSDNLASAYANEPQPWLLGNVWIAGFILGGLGVAVLAGFVGLFFFKNWARSLSLYLQFAGFLLHPFFGPSVSSGLETALVEACATIWGAILALSYFSPVSARFGR